MSNMSMDHFNQMQNVESDHIFFILAMEPSFKFNFHFYKIFNEVELLIWFYLLNSHQIEWMNTSFDSSFNALQEIVESKSIW